MNLIKKLSLRKNKNSFFTFFDVNDHSGQKIKNPQLLNSFNYLETRNKKINIIVNKILVIIVV